MRKLPEFGREVARSASGEGVWDISAVLTASRDLRWFPALIGANKPHNWVSEHYRGGQGLDAEDIECAAQIVGERGQAAPRAELARPCIKKAPWFARAADCRTVLDIALVDSRRRRG